MSATPQQPIRAVSPQAIRLEDGVVLLRPLQSSDAEDLMKSVDARMIEFTTISVSSPEDYTLPMAENFISAREGESGLVRWAITEPSKFGGRYCGNIGFRYDPNSPDPHQGSLGYNTSPWARGRGLQSRAVRLVTSYLFSQGFHRIELRARIDNTASRWVAEKAGYSFEGYARDAELSNGKYYDHAVYSALSTDSEYRS